MSDHTNGPTGEAAADEQVAQWIGDVPALVMRLDTWYTPEEFHPDMSQESLRLLEEAVVFTYQPEGTPESRDFLQGAMAYLGEALMAVGGGRWGRSADGHPVVLPDPELRLEPLDPLKLIIAAQERDEFGAFTEAVDALRAAVAERGEREPGWKPVKEPTPGLDPWAAEEPHPWLAGWLEERRNGFPAWAAETGSEIQVWDFSPRSLETLGRLVVERFGSREAFKAAEDTPFVQGAIWYVGEVAVHHRRGAWTYREAAERIPREEVEKNIYLERPFVNQPTVRDGVGEVPFYALLATVGREEPAVLLERLDRYKEPSEGDDSVIHRGV
ncbi:hypothetical protein J7E93_08650 [Streptomyces sp. ISL-36]|uniref:hypothetical protein n=1 Tax=Streptomyces sp. ISL-36 TaxID=2819182 RepID=UPI001BE7EE75|nr:hypothetical protein [Streptomyces sp. ISL-36]MBT2440183.1 hypothetical protein [Streptomyces sp. ISL-36]